MYSVLMFYNQQWVLQLWILSVVAQHTYFSHMMMLFVKS